MTTKGIVAVKQLKIEMTDDEHQRFKLYCVRNNTTMAEFLRTIVNRTITELATADTVPLHITPDTPEQRQQQAVKDIILAWETQPETVKAFRNSPIAAYFSLARPQGFAALKIPTIIEEMEAKYNT